jgi:hypothetical protein
MGYLLASFELSESSEILRNAHFFVLDRHLDNHSEPNQGVPIQDAHRPGTIPSATVA